MKPHPLPVVLLALSWAWAGAGAEFKLGGRTITVPDGYELELVARAPLTDRPIAISFDEQGRLYATDSAGLSERADKQLATKPHRVVRLEDTDGDGRYDKSVVFADKLMFPEGCLWHAGSLYVAAPPEIWKLTDTDGDGVADKREVWHDGKTLTGCANDLHGPYAGRDGWLYFTKGAFAEQKWTVHGKPFSTRAGHIFRARPDHSGLEPVMTGGMDNPVNVAHLSTGERFLSCTFFQYPAGGKRDGLIHTIYGGVYGKTHDSIYEHPMTGEVLPVLTHMGAAAPCGLAAGSGALFGGGFGDNLFACYFNLHKVVRHELVPDGATFTARNTDWVSSADPDFHPTDVLEDADGSLLIVDTGGWYKICCPTSQLAKPDVLGAIYRLRKKGAPRREDPRGLKIAWAQQTPAALASLFADPRPFVQQRAIEEAGKRGTAAVAELARVLAGGAAPAVKQNALWALTRVDAEGARQAARATITAREEAVRLTAIHSAALWRDRGALTPLIGALSRDPATARAAAEALGRLGDVRSIRALLAAAERLASFKEGDARRVLEHSLAFALIEIGDAGAVRAELERALPPARRELALQQSGVVHERAATLWQVALIALDQLAGGGLQAAEVTPLLDSRHPPLRQTAAWIVSHRPEWGAALADHFARRLARPSREDSERLALAAQLSQLARSPAIQQVLAQAVAAASTQPEGAAVALQAMAAAGLKETPSTWLATLAAQMPSLGDALLVRAVATARALPVPKGGHAGLAAAFAEVGLRNRAPVAARLEALAAAPPLNNLEPDLFGFLVAQVAPGQPLEQRTAAAQTLARARLSKDQQFALADALKQVGPLEAPRLLPAFLPGAHEALGLRVVESLKQSNGARGVRPDQWRQFLKEYPPSVAKAAEPLIASLEADTARQAAHLNALAAQLPPGDLRRGQEVFVSAKAGCTACHAIGYGGGRLGPDLTGIGKVRTERDLLEAIVYPSASFVRSYEPFTVVTKEGEDYTGIVVKDAPDEILLATGPQQEQRVPRANVAELRPGTVSLMPQGLEEVLSRQELADLIYFLKNAQR